MDSVKILTDAILRLTPGVAIEPELRVMEEILGEAGKAIQKMHRQLAEDEHTYAAIQVRYAQIITAAEDLEQQIEAGPPDKAKLKASLTKVTDQIKVIEPELDQDKVDVERTRSLLAKLEAAYRQKIEEIARARAALQHLRGF